MTTIRKSVVRSWVLISSPNHWRGVELECGHHGTVVCKKPCLENDYQINIPKKVKCDVCTTNYVNAMPADL